MNGDIADHSHMNALPLHSKLTDTFLERSFFPIHPFELFFLKIPKNKENCIMHKPFQVLDLPTISGVVVSEEVVSPVLSLTP